ncbi:SDR family NAD(P)-dependent oxidoreductase [Arthrobacter sp. 2RAF6]|uniref:SDR family NAD(P)-dependent oxidoreductase n=1 Tax=Arthrobacter sp. 2RAF6 TaxID=3233002 RepID=UPI003F92DAB5
MTLPRFAGKVAIVTGAAGGLGEASARRLAMEGAHVVAVDIKAEAAAAVARSLPTRSIAVAADVADETDVNNYIQEALDAFGRVDLHHLNAGIFGKFAALPNVEVEDFDRVMNVNVRGQFLGMRAAFRQFKAQRSGGNIAITASIASLTGAADLLAYHTSKHAVVGLVHGGSVYGGPLGVRVNAVAPGIVPTELFAAAASTSGGKNDMEQRASTTPMRRAGTVDEIATVVAFLLSEDSAYVTGQLIAADGGASIVNTVRPSGGAGAWDTTSVDEAIYGNNFLGMER